MLPPKTKVLLPILMFSIMTNATIYCHYLDHLRHTNDFYLKINKKKMEPKPYTIFFFLKKK